MGNFQRKYGYHKPPKDFMKNISERWHFSAPAIIPQPSQKEVTDFLVNSPAFLDDYVKYNVGISLVDDWLENKSRQNADKQKEHLLEEINLNSAKDERILIRQNPKTLSEEDENTLRRMENILSFISIKTKEDPLEMKRILDVTTSYVEFHPQLIESYQFTTDKLTDEQLIPVLIYMFENLFGRYYFCRKNLAQFFVDVQTNFFDAPFHNFRQAICDTQGMYWILKSCITTFTEVEKLTLMIATLCHDIGHPGLKVDVIMTILQSARYPNAEAWTNSIQLCALILFDKSKNLFHRLSIEEIQKVPNELKNLIRATNRKTRLEVLQNFLTLQRAGLSIHDEKYVEAIKCLLMVTCDLSINWKNWKNHFLGVGRLCTELYNQGDFGLGLGMEIESHEDRRKMNEMPKYQVNFIEEIVLPIFEAAGTVFPCMDSVINSTKNNFKKWIREFV